MLLYGQLKLELATWRSVRAAIHHVRKIFEKWKSECTNLSPIGNRLFRGGLLAMTELTLNGIVKKASKKTIDGSVWVANALYLNSYRLASTNRDTYTFLITYTATRNNWTRSIEAMFAQFLYSLSIAVFVWFACATEEGGVPSTLVCYSIAFKAKVRHNGEISPIELFALIYVWLSGCK